MIGARDPRTGAIRARADWSVIQTEWCKSPRAQFYCASCWDEIEAARIRPLPGIDRPKHASEFWKPSIMDMIRFAAIRLADENRRREAPLGYHVQRQQEERVTRIRNMPAKQYEQLLRLRRATTA